MFITYLRLTWFTAISIARFVWRIYPNMIEFYTNGIVFGGLYLMPWDKTELRPSTLYTDRIVVVLRPLGNQHIDTKIVRLSQEVKSTLLAMRNTANTTSKLD
jgi:hypothetical protein